MRFLIYHHRSPDARASLRIVDAVTAEEALERVRQTSPLGPDDRLEAVAESEADAKDWAEAEKESFTVTGTFNTVRDKIRI
jgi:hypothetical protein